MEYLIAIQAGLILMSSLVKTGLLSTRMRIAIAMCYAAFM
jgi:hypothetical protein